MGYTHKDLVWNESAVEVCDDEVLLGNKFTLKGVVSKEAHISGHCPYCYGEIEFHRKLKLLPASPGGTTGQGNGRRTMDITVTCTCALDHPHRPEGERGCGRSWVATAVK